MSQLVVAKERNLFDHGGRGGYTDQPLQSRDSAACQEKDTVPISKASLQQKGDITPSITVTDSEADASEYTLQNITSLKEVTLDEWNACLSSSEEWNPFITYEFLSALEESKSTTRFNGWLPYHLIMRRKDNVMVGCCPLYVKSHSQGEYVFDYQWAQVSAYMGTRYYPKLQTCVPFTPVPGSRLLVNATYADPKLVMRTLALGLKANTDTLNVSSAHLTFNLEEERQLLEEEGFISRMGVQYHWENNGYTTFDEFLMDLKQSKRKNIRQERKSIAKSGISIERCIGDDIKSYHWDVLYEFYRDTCDRKWGDPYLNREFFHLLGALMSDKIMLFFAKTDLDGYVAAAWNCIGSHALFGRNWGKRRYFECKHLHFELCYYQAIEAAIEMGLHRVEAGAQGEHKLQRGYLPKATHSSHYIRPEGLRSQIEKMTLLENLRMKEAIEYMARNYSPFKYAALIL